MSPLHITSCLPRRAGLLFVLSLFAGCTTRPAPFVSETLPPALERAAVAATSRPSPSRAGMAPAEGDRRIAVGVGFTDDPDTFLISGDADFYQSDRVAIGPSFQLGVDDDVTIAAPSFHAKIVFPAEPGSSGTQLIPFVQGGGGLAYINRNRRGDDDDWGLLLQAGGGLEIRFDEQYALSSTLMVNILPGDVNGEGAYLSWQLIQVTFTF